MAIDPALLTCFSATVDWLYAGLVKTAHPIPGPGREQGLGGKLFYAGEFDGVGSSLVVAANIAGAASLTATTDPAAQRQAIHDGVADFLVNSLGEALRILKNEIRKQETVAVCVALAPEAIEQEMIERGVLPDLLPPGALDSEHFEAFLEYGAQQINPTSADRNHTVLTWTVASAAAVWLPRLDAIATDSMGPDEWPARRWLRLAPRYLGRLASGTRLLRCERAGARTFIERVKDLVTHGEITVPVEINVSGRGETRTHRFTPAVGLGYAS